MKTIRLALVGFGNVGQGMIQILHEHGERLAQQFGLRFQVVAVNDVKLGSLYDRNGLPLEALRSAALAGDLSAVTAEVHGWSVPEMIEQAAADALVEVSFTNLQTGEPSLSYIRQALEKGLHVVTSNKGPIALHFAELLELAQSQNVQIGYEGSVMSGTPALALGRRLLLAAGIRSIQGILNGTTNFILTRMQAGVAYSEALAEAQVLGYAEADPTGDVEGYDAAGKVVILSQVLMGTALKMEEIERQGITHISPDDIYQAKAEGKCWKLIGTLEYTANGLKASVLPTMVPLIHPLAGVTGATNAITYTTDLLGDVTLIGPGAGRLETGYALVNDLLVIYANS